MERLDQKLRDLANEHLYVVKWAIRRHIYVNESVQGLGWDDLYQSGCVALCEAALEFNGSCQFKTFAQIFIKNKLIDYCRKIRTRQKNMKPCYLEDSIPDMEDLTYGDSLVLSITDPEPDDEVQEKIACQVARIKKNYNGITLKGIEALELRYKGYSGTEIAALYHVSPNHVFAWISRAKQKLNADGEIATLLNCCK